MGISSQIRVTVRHPQAGVGRSRKLHPETTTQRVRFGYMWPEFILMIGRRLSSNDEGPASLPGPFASIRGDQKLAFAPPLALQAPSDEAIEIPVFLQAFRPLQEFVPPLQALWPLQALVPTHLTGAAFADVDTAETTEPARNRVAAAAASVAPDLEFIFMTISSMIV
jgi:hypothetical protein